MVTRPTALTNQHDVNQLACTNPVLSNWLKKHALQSDQSGHTKTMVITSDGTTVVGYYSFRIISVEHTERTPTRVMKGLAKHAIPIFLIARLAVAEQFEGKRLGTGLMLDALARAAILSKQIPIRAVVVDALDDAAKSYSSRFDFEAWPPDGLRLWLLLKDVMKTIERVTKKE